MVLAAPLQSFPCPTFENILTLTSEQGPLEPVSCAQSLPALFTDSPELGSVYTPLTSHHHMMSHILLVTSRNLMQTLNAASSGRMMGPLPEITAAVSYTITMIYSLDHHWTDELPTDHDTLELLGAGLARAEAVLSEPESVRGRRGSLGPDPS